MRAVPATLAICHELNKNKVGEFQLPLSDILTISPPSLDQELPCAKGHMLPHASLVGLRQTEDATSLTEEEQRGLPNTAVIFRREGIDFETKLVQLPESNTSLFQETEVQTILANSCERRCRDTKCLYRKER